MSRVFHFCQNNIILLTDTVVDIDDDNNDV